MTEENTEVVEGELPSEEVIKLQETILQLTEMNKNLSGGFISMMKDLRKFSSWIMRSHLGSSIVTQQQFNEAKFMADTLDQVAKAKGWNITEEKS
jgi:hypothetical protein